MASSRLGLLGRFIHTHDLLHHHFRVDGRLFLEICERHLCKCHTGASGSSFRANGFRSHGTHVLYGTDCSCGIPGLRRRCKRESRKSHEIYDARPFGTDCHSCRKQSVASRRRKRDRILSSSRLGQSDAGRSRKCGDCSDEPGIFHTLCRPGLDGNICKLHG